MIPQKKLRHQHRHEVDHERHRQYPVIDLVERLEDEPLPSHGNQNHVQYGKVDDLEEDRHLGEHARVVLQHVAGGGADQCEGHEGGGDGTHQSREGDDYVEDGADDEAPEHHESARAAFRSGRGHDRVW
eukprot:CAMPEP_0172544388 /NCGR_PEP_ID=MMETSP1067-20121228/14562_1 /TAXON_ID=265564 ORGANISM="Thalassiosira punctigera, Strain Tpunct2005C2" /NCGR_SAMPLE_ID=MMETSP1067 /ASSEMBLY_ACC=CAM_ASM_000444 /LENGTH=128 /DNA_ID=CAMNT_0013330947 /DNA_START=534 /DNA_END=917 /DNA_ORIENTATION=+